VATGWVVFAVSCVLAAIAIPVGLSWSRLRGWRYPTLEDALPGVELVDPPPNELARMCALHDPAPLGFRTLGVLHAAPYWGTGALVKLWVDEATSTTVATVVVRARPDGGAAACRRAFITFHGDPDRPGSIQVEARSLAMLHHRIRPGSQVLYWPAADQAALLDAHRRLRQSVGPVPLRVSNLEGARQLIARANSSQNQWLVSSGVLRARRDGRLGLGRRAMLTSLGRPLPTPSAALRRADRRARQTVSRWPAAEPSSDG
jgi:hypothetical protein